MCVLRVVKKVIGWEVKQPQLMEPLVTSGGTLGFHRTLAENGWSGDYWKNITRSPTNASFSSTFTMI